MPKNSEPDLSHIPGPRYTDTPSTYFFYELEGPNSVEPIHLYWDGLVLWHEQAAEIETHDTRHLWEYAREIRHDPGWQNASVEHLRAAIIRGSLVPPGSNPRKVYPYRGMLISAIYFQECDRELDNRTSDRIWHLLIVAYYSMGFDTRAAWRSNHARSAAARHSADTEVTRSLILTALRELRDDASLTSITKAKDAVIKLIAEDKDARREIEKLDALQPSSLKHNKDGNALDRLRNVLDRWASPRGSYPEIAEAFDQFRRDKSPRKETTNAETLFEGATIKPKPFGNPPRLVYTLRDGGVWTTRFGANEPWDEAPSQRIKKVSD